MRKIIIKAIIAIVLAILMAKDSGMGVVLGVFATVFIYNIISWCGMLYGVLYGFGGVLRCIISLVGSVLVITAPMGILQAILPDNWFRTTLMAIGTIIMFAIPFVRDWKECKSEI